MEPLPESVEAMAELDPITFDDDLLDQLAATSERVRAVAPGCTGLSVTTAQQGVTLTLVATDAVVADLDAVQYVAGGPCIRAVEQDEVVAATHDVMDERGWQLFAAATAAHGIASTLSLPLVRDGRLVGGVNLYGAAPDTFDGHHTEIAAIFGSWAGAVVTNSDLSFSTREAARRAPQLLRDAAVVESATGLLAGLLRVDIEQAQERLDDAAQRADSDVVSLARLLVKLLAL